MSTTGETPTRRLALVVATQSYTDATLSQLQAPGRDAAEFAAALGDEAIGDFEVVTVLDAPAEQLRRRIASFCAEGGPADLALVYLSCHGVLDDRGRLYYATTDTDRSLLAATALPATWLNEQLEDCRCRRQILVLDCCHSGAFAKGAKGESDLALRERFGARGRVVLTGSRATEYSFEREGVVGGEGSSVFTDALVQGLRSGEADRDGDGMVTVSELYDHAYEQVKASGTPQTPTLWAYGAEGDLLIAHSPRGARVEPVPLPEDLAALLGNPRPRIREGAVAELVELLHSPDAGRALTARDRLERIADEDVPSVAAAARAALDGAPPAVIPPAALGTRALGTRTPKRTVPGRARQGAGSPRRRQAIAAAICAALAALAAAAILLLPSGSKERSSTVKVALGGSPSGIAVGEGATWVTRYAAGQVTRIDPSSDMESIAVGPHPDKVVAGQGSIWVTVQGGTRLVRIDPETHKVTNRVDIEAEGCECAITELAIAQEELLVGSEERRAILRLDLRTGEQAASAVSPGSGFRGLFTASEDTIWGVATEDTSAATSFVVRIPADTGAIQRIRIRRDSYFSGVAYAHQRVWIADARNSRNFVSVFDPASKRVVKNIHIATGIVADDIAATAGAVLVWDPEEGWLTKIDTREMKVVRKLRIAGYHRHAKFNREASDLSLAGGFAWVTDPVGNAVFKVAI